MEEIMADEFGKQGEQQEGREPAETIAVEQGASKTAPVAGGFDKIFNAALGLWKANLASLAVVTLVFCLVVWIPILNIAFIAGYLRALIKTVRGETVAVGDLFSAWDCFGSLLAYVVLIMVACLVLSLIPILGALAALALSFIVAPGFYAIVDQGTPPIEALKWSWKAFRADMGNWIAVILVGGIIAWLGMIALIIGVIITMPLGYLLPVLQYETQKELTV
jgi:hypothetical protein